MRQAPNPRLLKRKSTCSKSFAPSPGMKRVTNMALVYSSLCIIKESNNTHHRYKYMSISLRMFDEFSFFQNHLSLRGACILWSSLGCTTKQRDPELASHCVYVSLSHHCEVPFIALLLGFLSVQPHA
jgi:hypothetical protein